MNDEKDVAWQTLFDIRPKSVETPDTDRRQIYIRWVFEVYNVHTNELVGEYRDLRYARKQARHKYKKIIKLMEKSFMSTK